VPLCPPCRAGLPDTPPPRAVAGCRMVVSPFPYRDPIRRLVSDAKYRGRWAALRFLADRMGETIAARMGADPADRIVPIPLHPVRLRERGFNQAELLARRLSERLLIPMETALLSRPVPTRPQAALPRGRRAANVRSAFEARLPAALRGSRLLLVDDVVTTGRTAGEAARALITAGAGEVRLATAAQG